MIGNVSPGRCIPNIKLRPVQERMHTHMRPGSKVGLILAPEFGAADLRYSSRFVYSRGEKIALLGAASFFIRADPHDHAGVRLRIFLLNIMPKFVIERVAWPFPRKRVLERFALQGFTASQTVHLPVRKGLLGCERLRIFAV